MEGDIMTISVTVADESIVPMEEVRQGVREEAQAITRVNTSLATLRSQLIEMREQDLHLLRQLIHIGDSIRKLSRSHERYGGKRKSHRATQELMTSAADLSVTLRRFKGRSGSLFGGENSTVPLVRRQSEPQVCLLSPPADVVGDVRSWDSRRGSISSTDWWSEDTLGSSEDGLDLSDDNLNDTTTTSINITTITTSNELTTTATATSATKFLEFQAELPTDHLHRPKSHSVVASTFLSGRSNLSGGNSDYSDILTKNVSLWKNRLEKAKSVRERVSILEEEG